MEKPEEPEKPTENPVLVRLRVEEDNLVAQAKAPNTVKAYAQSWKKFNEWLRTDQCPPELFQDGVKVPIPVSPEVVRAFITWAFTIREPHYKAPTIQVAISAIKKYHALAGFPPPVDVLVRESLDAMKRQAARGRRDEQAGKRHLTVEVLKRICQHCPANELAGLRDRSIILLGFASALRRSDIARLETRHIHFQKGHLRIWVPFSKTDQAGEGRDVFIDCGDDPLLCPVRALEAWKKGRIEHCGNFQGPLYVRFNNHGGITRLPLSDAGICLMLKRRLNDIGEDPRDYGAHSMRSGMITAADGAGANLRAIMDRTGHKQASSVMRYIKSNRSANPLAGVL